MAGRRPGRSRGGASEAVRRAWREADHHAKVYVASEIAAMRVALSARVLLLLAALLLLVIAIQSSWQRGFVRAIPGTAIGGESFANQLDLAVRGDTLHVLWRVSFTSSAGRPSRLLYIRSDDGGRHWGRPLTVGRDRGRVFSGATRLHVLEGRRLEHSLSADGGRTWARTAALATAQYGARGCDGMCLGDTLLLAYLCPRGRDGDDWAVIQPPGAPGRQPFFDLHVVRWDPSQRVTEQVVASFPVHWWDPRSFVGLARSGDRLDVLAGVDDRESVPESTGYGVVRTLSSRAKLFLCSSEDRGAHWGAPVELLAGEGEVQGPFGAVAAWRGPELLVGYSGDRLPRPRPPGGPAPRIGFVEFAADYPEHGSRTLDIAASGRDAVAVWITTALAGWSWAGFAENPGDAMMIGMGWRQTDVFAARIPGGSGLKRLGATSGLRLTGPRAHASSLRAAIVDGTLACVWAGRSKVGRSPFAYGAPAELFCARVPVAVLPVE